MRAAGENASIEPTLKGKNLFPVRTKGTRGGGGVVDVKDHRGEELGITNPQQTGDIGLALERG